MTVTVVICTYNRARMLRRAVESVINQTYGDWKVLICDNASTDATKSIAETYCERDSRISYHRHNTNIGAPANFRFGMQAPKTPFFLMLSDDDFLLPRMLAVVMENFARYPQAMFSAGGTVEMTERGQVIFAPLASWDSEGLFSPPDSLRPLMDGHHPSWTTIAFRRDVVDKLGLFYEDIREVSDIEFTLRIASRFPYAVSREPLGVFFRHADSNGEVAGSDIAAQFETMLARLTAPADVSDEVRKILEESLPRAARFKLLQSAVKALCRGDREEAGLAIAEFHKRSRPTPTSAGLWTMQKLVPYLPGSVALMRLLSAAYIAIQARTTRRESDLRGVSIDERFLSSYVRQD